MKVLLVEDVDDSQGGLRAMIERLGHRAIEATDGKQAVEATINHNPDCVLMHLGLPAIDGLQATAAIRAISGFKERLSSPSPHIQKHSPKLKPSELAVMVTCGSRLTPIR